MKTGISIFMPVYNGIEFIEESVLSVISQTYIYWELIIAVNGHPPNSDVYKTAKKYENRHKNIRVLDFHHIKGKSNTLNALVPMCIYNHIALLDVDDIWLPNKLMKQSQYLDKYNVIGTQCVYFGESQPIIPNIPCGDISNFNFKLTNPIINSSCIIHKMYAEWKPVWDGIEDYELWLQLRKQNCTFYNIQEVLVKHRIHSSSAFNAKGNGAQVPKLLSLYNF